MRRRTANITLTLLGSALFGATAAGCGSSRHPDAVVGESAVSSRKEGSHTVTSHTTHHTTHHSTGWSLWPLWWSSGRSYAATPSMTPSHSAGIASPTVSRGGFGGSLTGAS